MNSLPKWLPGVLTDGAGRAVSDPLSPALV